MKICATCGRTYPDETAKCAVDGGALTAAESTGGLVGQILDGRYAIEAPLGSGGLGEVYRARHLKMGKSFAVKLLHGALASDPAFIARFDREARALSKLEHPYCVAAIDYGTSAQGPYIVMDLVEGTPLAHYTRGHGLPLGEALQIVAEMLAGLEHAHGHGIVHRDLKPDNVMLVKDPLTKGKRHPKILDFGIAKIRAGVLKGAAASTLTQLGTLVGTPAYLAPEQAAGSGVDERTDLYACGVILYELACGRRPFENADKLELIRAQLLTPPPPPRDYRPGLPDALVKVILKALAKKPSERWQTAEKFREALLAAAALPAKLAAERPPPRAGAAQADVSTTSVDEVSAIEDTDQAEEAVPGGGRTAAAARVTTPGKPAARRPPAPPAGAAEKRKAVAKSGGGGAGRAAMTLVGLAILGAVAVGAWMLAHGDGGGSGGAGSDSAGADGDGDAEHAARDRFSSEKKTRPEGNGAARSAAPDGAKGARLTAAPPDDTGAPVTAAATAAPRTAASPLATAAPAGSWIPPEELRAAEASFRKYPNNGAATSMRKYLFAHKDDVEGRLFAARAFLVALWLGDGLDMVGQALKLSPALELDDDTLVALGHAFRGASTWKALSIIQKHGGDRAARALLVAAVVVPFPDIRPPLLWQLKKMGVPSTPAAADLLAVAETSDCAKRNEALARAGTHRDDPAVPLALRWLAKNKCLAPTVAALGGAR